MSDDPIGGLLRSLPRAEPTAGFTGRVMARIEESRPRRVSGRMRIAWGAALVALVVASVGGGMVWQQQREAARVEAMRAETARIRAELEQIRARARDANEIYLGQSGDREYVLDLRQFTAPDAEVKPASQTF